MGRPFDESANPPLAQEPQPDGTNATPAPVSDVGAHESLTATIAGLLEQGQRGANWFYWVAGLSLVNSTIMLNGGNTFFVVGMAVTLIIDAFATGVANERPELATAATATAVVLDLAVALTVAAFGWFAGKRYLIVFVIGMVLYSLDGVIFALFEDWMSVGFHAFALFGMWSGLSAFMKLRTLERTLISQTNEPLLPPGVTNG